MKKTTKLIFYCFLVCFVAIGLSSCKKSSNTSRSLLGDWTEQVSPAGYSKGLAFSSDGTFVATFVSYPHPTPGAVAVLEITHFKGTYYVKGDSLVTTVTSMTVKQGDNSPVTTPSNQKLYEYATIKVKGNSLTVNYTTYPADAPVPTTANFTRFLPD